jgi:hypothetical protein
MQRSVQCWVNGGFSSTAKHVLLLLGFKEDKTKRIDKKEVRFYMRDPGDYYTVIVCDSVDNMKSISGREVVGIALIKVVVDDLDLKAEEITDRVKDSGIDAIVRDGLPVTIDAFEFEGKTIGPVTYEHRIIDLSMSLAMIIDLVHQKKN